MPLFDAISAAGAFYRIRVLMGPTGRAEIGLVTDYSRALRLDLPNARGLAALGLAVRMSATPAAFARERLLAVRGAAHALTQGKGS